MRALRIIDAIAAIAIVALIFSLILRLRDHEGMTDAMAAYCDSLDAIAVKTPGGWECVTRAVIPADTVRR